MTKCPRCGIEYKLSKRDSIMRKLVAVNSKLFPARETVVNSADEYCNNCYSATVKPDAMSMLESVKEKQDEPQTAS